MLIAGIILSRKPWNDLGFSLIRSSFIMLLNVQESRCLNFVSCVCTYTIYMYRVVFVMIFCRICWCTDSNLYIDEISISKSSDSAFSHFFSWSPLVLQNKIITYFPFSQFEWILSYCTNSFFQILHKIHACHVIVWKFWLKKLKKKFFGLYWLAAGI